MRAGRDVQRALASDTDAARASLAALVSRSPDLDPPLIVSATIESLAENLTDSVVSPLLYYALFGLPGALAYRAVNTMDAMLGYRDEREYVGKAAARSDDAANWVPTRITGLLLVGGLGAQGHRRRAPGGRSARSTSRSTDPTRRWPSRPWPGASACSCRSPAPTRWATPTGR